MLKRGRVRLLPRELAPPRGEDAQHNIRFTVVQRNRCVGTNSRNKRHLCELGCAALLGCTTCWQLTFIWSSRDCSSSRAASSCRRLCSASACCCWRSAAARRAASCCCLCCSAARRAASCCCAMRALRLASSWARRSAAATSLQTPGRAACTVSATWRCSVAFCRLALCSAAIYQRAATPNVVFSFCMAGKEHIGAAVSTPPLPQCSRQAPLASPNSVEVAEGSIHVLLDCVGISAVGVDAREQLRIGAVHRCKSNGRVALRGDELVSWHHAWHYAWHYGRTRVVCRERTTLQAIRQRAHRAGHGAAGMAQAGGHSPRC